ncbi:MAG: response regulator transcription factor [Blastocatellia bacterium]|nr:response regulator transcription factor [Blastocatellia bacterium]
MATSSPENPIRILLVDDHAIVRAGLRLLIHREPGLQVIGEVSNGRDALAAVQAEAPDIVLLDLDLGDENGLDLLPLLLESASAPRVIVLTGLRDQQTHQRAVSLGALGIVNKENAQEVILSAIARVHAGEAFLDPKLTASLLAQLTGAQNQKNSDPEAAKIASLSKRELEVVKLVGEGLKSKEIAGKLFISEITVRHHLTSIFAKLEVSDRVELMLYSYRNGLAQAPR